MNRMHIFYVVIFLLLVSVIGVVLFIHFQRQRNNFQISNVTQASEPNYSDLEEGKLKKENKKFSILNPAKNYWQIYNNGISTVDLSEDFAQALLAFPSQNGDYKVPPMVFFDSFQTRQGGPYNFQLTPQFEFEFFVILTYGGTFNLNGKNLGKYISRASIMVPHTKTIRENELNLFCKLRRVFVETNRNQEEIAIISLILWAKFGNIEKKANIIVNGEGGIKIIF